MTPESKQKAIQVADKIDTARTEIAELVSNDPNLNNIHMRVDKHLQLLSNQVKAIIGVSPENTTSGTVEFAPLSKIDGEELTGDIPADVKDSDLTINNSDVALLKEKVLRFEESLHERTDDEVLAAVITTDDILVIRGLAKKANVNEFDTAEINHSFVQAIREGLAQLEEASKADRAALVAKIKLADTVDLVKELGGGDDHEDVKLAVKERLTELGYDPKAEILQKIKEATTEQDVKDLAVGNDDEEIQNAALDRLIQIEGGVNEN